MSHFRRVLHFFGLTKFRLLGRLTIPGKRFDIKGDHGGVEFRRGRIWVDVGDGAVCCDPSKEILVLAFDRDDGVGVFSWQPKKRYTSEALQTNVSRVRDILRGEEKKAFAVIERAGPIVRKRLNGRKPTEADYAYLKETHGIFPDLVNDLVA